MQYSFFSRSFSDADEAHEAFMHINEYMHIATPDAFLVAYEGESDNYVVLLGCNDGMLEFVDEIDEFWQQGCKTDVPVAIAMALEARHCRMLSEHYEQSPSESLWSLTDEPIDIMADGSSEPT